MQLPLDISTARKLSARPAQMPSSFVSNSPLVDALRQHLYSQRFDLSETDKIAAIVERILTTPNPSNFWKIVDELAGGPKRSRGRPPLRDRWPSSAQWEKFFTEYRRVLTVGCSPVYSPELVTAVTPIAQWAEMVAPPQSVSFRSEVYSPPVRQHRRTRDKAGLALTNVVCRYYSYGNLSSDSTAHEQLKVFCNQMGIANSPHGYYFLLALMSVGDKLDLPTVTALKHKWFASWQIEAPLSNVQEVSDQLRILPDKIQLAFLDHIEEHDREDIASLASRVVSGINELPNNRYYKFQYLVQGMFAATADELDINSPRPFFVPIDSTALKRLACVVTLTMKDREQLKLFLSLGGDIGTRIDRVREVRNRILRIAPELANS